jgi:hypothetical protein
VVSSSDYEIWSLSISSTLRSQLCIAVFMVQHSTMSSSGRVFTLLKALIVACLCTLQVHADNDSQSRRRVWKIDHALVADSSKSPHWQPRGEAVLTFTAGGSINLTMSNSHNATASSEWIDDLVNAAWYQLQFKEQGESMPAITTTVPVCMIRRAHFR